MSAYREKIVQWVSRQSREVQQWTANELIDGDCFERRQPGRTLPQLPRFGMSVAQEYFLMFETCVISNSWAWQKSHIRQPLRD